MPTFSDDLTHSFPPSATACFGDESGLLITLPFIEPGMPFKEAKQRVVDAFERAYLSELLRRHQANITRSAQAAGLTRYHLRELIKRHHLGGPPALPEGPGRPDRSAPPGPPVRAMDE